MYGIQHRPASTVVAIDFGCHGTGFGHSFDGGQTCKLQTNYPDAPYQYPKTLTALLYKDREPISFGWTALREYEEAHEARLKAAAEGSLASAPTYRLITAFKRLLEDPNDPMVQELPPGITRIQVIADFFAVFKRHVRASLLAEVGSSKHHLVAADAITWILTVPSMWSDSAKADMREAAVRAGLINRTKPEQLVIALEPESAALWIKSDDPGSFQSGNTVMVLDAGGGTVDWTIHSCVERGGQVMLAEAAASEGEMLGSQQLDKAFLALFKEEVGEEAFQTWHNNHPLEGLGVLKQWEHTKCSFSGNSAHISRITIPPALHQEMTEDDRMRLKVEYGSDDLIELSNETMRSLFDPTIEKIIEKSNQQLREVTEAVDKVLMVGGFSSSGYMQQRIRNEVHQSGAAPDVVTISQPYAAVLRGAVIFGCNPGLISARRVRSSYGVRACGPYEEGAPNKFLHSEENAFYSDAFFSCFVDKGQSVEVDETVDHFFIPMYKTQPQCDVEMYIVDACGKRFVDELDPNTRRLATLTIPLDTSLTSMADRVVRISFHFGRTEITATATVEASQTTRQVLFRYATC